MIDKFYDPTFFDKVDRISARICTAWQVHRDVQWHVWQMVATLESGAPTKLSYSNHGLSYNGWGIDGNPNNAYQGFYRECPYHNEVGNKLHILRHTAPADWNTDSCYISTFTYGAENITLHWESEPHIWGYAICDWFDDESTARQYAADLARESSYIRSDVTFSERSYRWRVKADLKRKPATISPDRRTATKTRVRP